MQKAAWINLIRRIPPIHHDCMVLMTTIGNEIVLQRMVRMERDFFIALARMSGSTDEGKIMILPYDEITYVTFNKRLTEPEVQSLLSNPLPAGMSPEPEIDVARPEQHEVEAEPKGETGAFPFPQPTPAAAEEPPPIAQAAPVTMNRAAPPSKSILLARLKQRLASDVGKPANPNP